MWDGPELIWTEDFRELNHTNVGGYERRNWGTYTTFDNGWLDLFRKVIDGTIYIPSRKEVIERNKVVIINNDNSGNDAAKYATPGDLYDGLYKQTDHFNKGNGQFMDNLTYFKKTGRYQAIPVVIDLYDSLAKTIPTQVKRTAYSSTWPSQTRKVTQFNKLYPEISTGDLFVSRHNNELITYYPFSYFRKATTASAEIPLLYNSCDTLGLVYGKFGNGVINEYADHIDVYLNNFRSDTTTLVTDQIIIRGATSQPSYTFSKRVAAKANTPTESFDAETGTYTLTIKHLGPVELSIQCAGNGNDKANDKLNPNSSLSLNLPAQPSDYYGDLIHEAEDMDYKSVGRLVTHQYNQARNYRGHSGMGMVEMGSNTAGSLRDSIYVKHPGAHSIRIRYVNTSGKNFNLTTRVNGSRKSVLISKTNTNDWQEATVEAELKEGGNAFIIQNTAGVNFTIGQRNSQRFSMIRQTFHSSLIRAKTRTPNRMRILPYPSLSSMPKAMWLPPTAATRVLSSSISALPTMENTRFNSAATQQATSTLPMLKSTLASSTTSISWMQRPKAELPQPHLSCARQALK